MNVDYEIVVHGNNLRLRDGFLGLANASLVTCDAGPLLFDVGHYCNRSTLLNALSARGMQPSDIKAVFLSHLHFDHCNNVDLFPDAKILVSAKEWNYVDNPHEKDLYIPWMIKEQLQKHDVTLIQGEQKIAKNVKYFPAPGHTPGSFALQLDTEMHGCVILAGDALKYPKEAISRKCDMAFDTLAAGTNSIRHILNIADRIVPGHFPELIKEDGQFIWKDTAELSLVVR
jgi:N-acyl homoserine lactone hydrolase